MDLRSLLHLDRRDPRQQPEECPHGDPTDAFCWPCFFEEAGVAPATVPLDPPGVELDPAPRSRWA
jgi:hypothetical protein